MIKKNIRPQQSAPVQRQVTTTSGQGEKALFASTECDILTRQCTPFAGDDGGVVPLILSTHLSFYPPSPP
ncbi:anacyclamide/piricyclamide family prenylated cyclic peptide [Planktothrix agardhii]|uniref:anacyclamide/piricyclamide family prenylated cyclic peptide n=1 Tax=Planktothrix agardhii TaxID=1160 RepID=UPI0005A6F21F|nr:anacyclamide/piricyclamide family prenylated cyclic peptide [Planktothrix agardhii]CAD5937754.1 Cyanobactin peptide [Planktothrix agardhii]